MTRAFLNIILIFSLSAFISGCANTSKASAEKSDAAKVYKAPENKGTVFLYRTPRAVGAAGQLLVKVNGQDAGGTGPGTFFRWDLNPGTYTFASSTNESSAVIQIDLKIGDVFYIRQDARMGLDNGRVTMKEVNAKQGSTEVSGCKLLVSSYLPE